jgi:hypothetical protein
MRDFLITAWIERPQGAVCLPNPDFPHGQDIPPGLPGRHCKVALRYPAPSIGTHRITCTVCGNITAVTADGHASDPRSIMIRCLGKEAAHG